MSERYHISAKPDRRKGKLGLLLAAFFFLIFMLGYSSWLRGSIFFMLFAAAGFFQFDFKETRTAYAAYCIWTLLCVAFLALFPYYEIYNERIWGVIREYTPASTFLISSILILAGIFLFYGFSAKWRLSVSIVYTILSLLVIINGYVYRLRGKELLFSDIYALGTALNVADQYTLAMERHTLLAVAAGVLLLFTGWCLPTVTKPAGHRRKSLILSVILMLSFVLSTRNMELIAWNSNGTLMYGYYANLYISIRDYFVEKPESYSAESIRSLEQEYTRNTDGAAELPDILIIMNESFADMRIFSEDLQTNQPVTPFLDSLKENMISGYALTSVYGGGTANAEFEALSGFSMQFFPDNSTPYQQYIHEKTFSLPWVLDSAGYNCMATHPYLANGWSRPKVYPAFGFSESTFIEDYPQKNIIRYYVSDQEMYEYMLQKMDTAGEAPVFLFGITMQNHGGYETPQEYYTKTIWLENSDQAYPQAEEYLSMLNYSDMALEYLITELENRPKKTVVLFFGDHLPQIEPAFYEELYDGGFDTLDDQLLKYTVPFFVWANYDIPEQTVPCTSLNYLGRYLLEAAGIDLPPYYQFLKEAESVIPAISAMGYYSKSAQAFLPADAAQGAEAEWLSRYEMLQYNAMFDSNPSEVFFGNHIRAD